MIGTDFIAYNLKSKPNELTTVEMVQACDLMILRKVSSFEINIIHKVHDLCRIAGAQTWLLSLQWVSLNAELMITTTKI